MLQLPIKYIKDAARSVKRVCMENFRKTKDSALTELVGISMLVVTMVNFRREDDYDVLHLWCAHRQDIACCPKCGTMSDKIHSEKPRCVRHLDACNQKTHLHFSSRRFKCEICNVPFTEQLSFVDGYRRQTIAFELYIYECCLSCNRKKVAKQAGLSQSTVKDILKRYSKSKVNPRVSSLTRVLGIDEISLKKRHKQFALVISDIDRKCILAVFPDRLQDSLIGWIKGLSKEQRMAIRYVSIDMWRPYYKAVRKTLSHAKVVVDRFHVMKHLNERISSTRRKIQRDIEDDAIKQALKGTRWILVRNRENLTTKDENKLQEILDLWPELRKLYLLKEEFRLIFEKIDNREKAERFLSAWKRKALYIGGIFIKRFINTLNNWWSQILNYFEERITNGFVEGLNNAIRGIIRRAFGFRNFENFKLQVFAEQGSRS